MTYERLADFVQYHMRMSHVYQPVMLLALLRGGSRRFSSNNGSMIIHCWSVRSMPVRYDGSTVTVYERTSNLTLIALRLRNATSSVFHQRHIGRVLRSS
jgi:hypothetical protein